jgi:hypothetical protein
MAKLLSPDAVSDTPDFSRFRLSALLQGTG